MANYEATKYNFDGANLTDIEGVNTGLIVPWSDSTVPSGFLECDGTAVSRTTYANLFAVVGTTYGSGDGSTTFGLPDLTDKCIVSKSPTKSFASTGGANTVSGSGNVSANMGNTSLGVPTIASHGHGTFNSFRDYITERTPQPQSWARVGNTTSPSSGGSGGHKHPFSVNVSLSANSVLQPYLTVKYIIKT